MQVAQLSLSQPPLINVNVNNTMTSVATPATGNEMVMMSDNHAAALNALVAATNPGASLSSSSSNSNQSNNNNQMQINTISQIMTNYTITNGENSNQATKSSLSIRNQPNANSNSGNYKIYNNQSFDQLSVASSQSKVLNKMHQQQNNGIIKNHYEQQQQQQQQHYQSQPPIYVSRSNQQQQQHQLTHQRSVNFDGCAENNSKRNNLQQQDEHYSANNRGAIKSGSGNNNNGMYYDKIYNDPNNPNIQVQILPQDDNWGENTTAVTGDFSDFNDDMTEDSKSSHFPPQSSKNKHFFRNKMQLQLQQNDHLNKYDNQNDDNIICIGRFMTMFAIYLRDYFGYICAILSALCSFITPILFMTLPRLNLFQPTVQQQQQQQSCGLECEGLIIGISFKLFILLMGTWAIFGNHGPGRAIMPRIYELRALIIFLLCIMTFSYWLFYSVRIIATNEQDYFKILQFTVSYVDVLLFIFIVSVFLIKLRQLQPEYVVRVVRSPDGHQYQYNLGNMSIQRAAVWLLEQYYKDFPVYNHWLDNSTLRQKRNNAGIQLLQLEQSSMSNNKKRGTRNGSISGSIKNFNDKFENIDEKNNTIISNKKINSTNVSRSALINYNANDRFYEEYELERRLRKRRARLLTSTEEAFTHIRRVQSQLDSQTSLNENGANQDEDSLKKITLMDPFEAAQAIFSSIARDLRRYLRVTRQQPFFTRESIVAHLANCISYDMSPKSFLQRFLAQEPLVFNERVSNQVENKFLTNGVGSHGVNYHLNLKTIAQSWILICDTVLYQNIEDNLMIVLKQNDVSLMCSFKRLPKLNLIEDILDPKRNKFILKLNSETTV